MKLLTWPMVCAATGLAQAQEATMPKERQEFGDEGFEALGMTAGHTAVGGAERVVLMGRKAR